MTLYDAALAGLQKVLDDHESLDAQIASANAAAVDQLKQESAEAAADLAAVQGAFDTYKASHPDQPPPARQVKTVFSVFPGPATVGGSDSQNAAARARACTALGVTVLPADRVYAEGNYPYANNGTARSSSPVVAISYKQVPALAAGDAATTSNLTKELQALKALPAQTFYVALDHEIDNKLTQGAYTLTQYKAALIAFNAIVAGVAAPNVKRAVCFMGWTFTQPSAGKPNHPANWFVAGDYDVVALDPYWTPPVTAYKTASAAYGGAWSWAQSTGLPVHVWELGFYTLGDQTKQPNYAEGVYTQRLAQSVAYWKGKADHVLWFDANKTDGLNLIESHPDALSIWAAAVQGQLT